MSSSKVFKRTSAFVPEKIISRRKKEESGWKSVGMSRGKQGDAFVAGSEYERIHRHQPPGEHDFSETDGGAGPESAHKTDFSAPDLSPEAYGETELSVALDGEQPDIKRLQEEAYERGLRDGVRRADEDFGSSAKALVMACEQIGTLRETILNNSMAEMQNLVLIIAEKIIRHSVTEQDRTIVDTVEEAIHQAVKSDEFIIQVNPADLAVIKEKSKEFLGSLSGLENIVVQANPAIEQGGCMIDSSTSTVDATLAGQLQIIEDKIKGKT